MPNIFDPSFLFQPPANRLCISLAESPTIATSTLSPFRPQSQHSSKWASRISSPMPVLPVCISHQPFALALLADSSTIVLNNWLLTRSYITG